MAEPMRLVQITDADPRARVRAIPGNRFPAAPAGKRQPRKDDKNHDDAIITDGEALALARAMPGLFKRWEINDRQARTLLGGMSQSTWGRWKKGNIGEIGRDLRMRMAHLVGIHMGLRTIFREPEIGYAWVRSANDNFEGARPLDVMLGGELSDLEFMRQWIDSETGT